MALPALRPACRAKGHHTRTAGFKSRWASNENTHPKGHRRRNDCFQVPACPGRRSTRGEGGGVIMAGPYCPLGHRATAPPHRPPFPPRDAAQRGPMVTSLPPLGVPIVTSLPPLWTLWFSDGELSVNSVCYSGSVFAFSFRSGASIPDVSKYQQEWTKTMANRTYCINA